MVGRRRRQRLLGTRSWHACCASSATSASRLASPAQIVAARPIATTAELAEIVRNAIPAAARRTGGHPAKRTFQAIRIEVNRELEILPQAIDAGIEALATDGRIAVLAYHSGEDRIVKDRLRQAATGGCTCPPGLPCVCEAVRTVRLVGPAPASRPPPRSPTTAAPDRRACGRRSSCAPDADGREG